MGDLKIPRGISDAKNLNRAVGALSGPKDLQVATEVQTSIPVPSLDSEMGSARLHLSTRKREGSSGIYSAASVHFINADGNITFEAFGDFRRVCARRPGAATQKALNSLHAQTFTAEAVESLLLAASAFYVNKGGV